MLPSKHDGYVDRTLIFSILCQCVAKGDSIETTSGQRCKLAGGGGVMATQQTPDLHPMLGLCWATVEDDGQTLTQQRVDILTGEVYVTSKKFN